MHMFFQVDCADCLVFGYILSLGIFPLEAGLGAAFVSLEARPFAPLASLLCPFPFGE